jgi:ankyrin repeat protein
MAAAENNRLDFVKWLLAQGANVNASMYTGWTAMHCAAKKNHHDVLGALLEGGGDRNMKSHHRGFGSGLKPVDVSKDSKTISMLQ